MAIAPPSDILLDVANAADPAKLRAATERLAKLAADPAAGNEAFSKALASARSAGEGKAAIPARAASGAKAVPMPSWSPRPAMRVAAGKNETYQKFEAVLLQSFVESMLPKDDELFGDKTSSGAYRSMMAEQFATQIAKAGGIGIAAAVEHAHPATHAHAGKPAAKV